MQPTSFFECADGRGFNCAAFNGLTLAMIRAEHGKIGPLSVHASADELRSDNVVAELIPLDG